MRKQIQRLLDSDLSSLHIAKQSGVEQSTVYRLRSGERQLGKLGLDNAEKLYNFANDIFVDEDSKQQLLMNRASIMGMLKYMELTDEEAQRLNEEKEEIEGKLTMLKIKNKVYEFLKNDFEVVSDHNKSNYQHLKVQNENYIIYYSSNGYYDNGSFEIYNRKSGKVANSEVDIKEGDENSAIEFIKCYQ